MAFNRCRHARGHICSDSFDRLKAAIAEPSRNVFGFEAQGAGQRVNFTLKIDHDETASVASSQMDAAFFQALFESAGAVGRRPAFLQKCLERPWIVTLALGLLPLGEVEIERVTLGAVDQPQRIPADRL